MIDTKFLKHALVLYSLMQREMKGSHKREGLLQLDGRKVLIFFLITQHKHEFSWRKKKQKQKVISIIKRHDKRFRENAKLCPVLALSIRQSNVCRVAAVILHITPYISSCMPFCLMVYGAAHRQSHWTWRLQRLSTLTPCCTNEEARLEVTGGKDKWIPRNSAS